MEDAHGSPPEQSTAIVVSREIAVTVIAPPSDRRVASRDPFRELVLRTLDAVDELADDVAIRLGLR